jgi:hypothetical protein
LLTAQPFNNKPSGTLFARSLTQCASIPSCQPQAPSRIGFFVFVALVVVVAHAFSSCLRRVQHRVQWTENTQNSLRTIYPILAVVRKCVSSTQEYRRLQDYLSCYLTLCWILLKSASQDVWTSCCLLTSTHHDLAGALFHRITCKTGICSLDPESLSLISFETALHPRNPERSFVQSSLVASAQCDGKDTAPHLTALLCTARS